MAAAQPGPLPKGTRVRVETYNEAGRFSFSIIQANEAALVDAVGVPVRRGRRRDRERDAHERPRAHARDRHRARPGHAALRVVRLFVLEGLALGVVSAVVGALAGGPRSLYLAATGIPMKAITLAWMAGGDVLFPVLVPASLLRAGGSIVLLSTLAAIYPAFTASRLEPREALHHV